MTRNYVDAEPGIRMEITYPYTKLGPKTYFVPKKPKENEEPLGSNIVYIPSFLWW